MFTTAATFEHQTYNKPDLVRDIFLWRKRNLSIIVLLVTTATWVALEIYQFNFITVASWVAMFLVAVMFVWSNIQRILGKEVPDMSWMEISDKSAMEMANKFREWIEEGERWMFRVGAEREWFVFAIAVASSWLLSLIASRFDLLTLLYFGVVLGMTVPAIYVKYEDKIKEYGWRLRMQSQKYHGMIQEKLKKIKSRVAGDKKEKKTE